MKSFFAELKRRNVYKVAVAYAVVAWLLIQIATQVFPFLQIPNWAIRLVIMLVALGFPIALIIAWAFELTPEGVQSTESAAGAPRKRSGGRAWIYIALVGIIVSAALFFGGRYTPSRAPAERGPAAKSVAVLPFDNLSEDKANAYFADGMQDEIITRLAKIGDLKVISRTSTLPYRNKPEKLSEIARQLGVAHIVEGTVQRIADRVRINVQLVESATDEHLWAELYDRKISDVFEVQSEVATKIAASLRAKLSGEERSAIAQKPTSNLVAYDAYLRGIDLNSRPGQTFENQRKAIDAFGEAVRLDPSFAQAWAALSEVHASLYFLQLDTSSARKENARKSAEAATRLAPNAPETLLANAYYRYHVKRDYEGARVLFEQIHHDVPSSSEAVAALARIARRQSRWKDSIHLYEEAARLNPRDTHLAMDRVWTFTMVREFPAAADMIASALTISPDDVEVLVNKRKLLQITGDLAGARAVLDSISADAQNQQGLDLLATQFVLERRYAEAAKLIESYLPKRINEVPIDGFSAQQFLGWARLLAGDAERARQAYVAAKRGLETVQREQPQNPYIASMLGFIEVGLGNKEAALQQGERAVALLPQSQDPVYAPIFEESLAAIEAQVGESDRALDRIERLLVTPYGAFPLTQATLRVDPIWDPLRQHPRFKALVEGPEPKTIYN